MNNPDASMRGNLVEYSDSIELRGLVVLGGGMYRAR